MVLVEALCFPKSLRSCPIAKIAILPKIAEIELFRSFAFGSGFRLKAPASLTPSNRLNLDSLAITNLGNC